MSKFFSRRFSRPFSCPLLSTRPVVIFLGLALLLCGTAAAQCDSQTNGSFNAAATWTCGFVPGPSTTVQIFHTVDSTTDIAVNSLDIFSGGVLVMNGFPLEIEVQTMVVQGGGNLVGAANSSIYITAPPGFPFDITNDGTIEAGALGGDIFIHDGGPGGDIPCPSGSRVSSTNGTFSAAPNDGNIYILADQIDLNGAIINGGAGFVPYNAICRSVAGSVYIAGVDVTINGASQIYQGLNANPNMPPLPQCNGVTTGPLDGSVRVQALSCNTGGGNLSIGGTTIVGNPLANANQCTTVFGTTSTIGANATINGGTSCVYWDPPLLELNDDASVKADHIIVAGEDLDASGLASRTLPTPALDAGDILEIRLQPGGQLDLQNLAPGFNYFQAGSQIIIAADEDQILTDSDVTLEELMSPPPELVPAESTFVVSLNPDSERPVHPGSSVEHPFVASNLSTGSGLLDVYIEDYKGWLQGGPVSVSVNVDSGEALVRTLTINVPASAAPGDYTVIKAVASINGGPQETSLTIFQVAKKKGCKGRLCPSIR